MVETECDKVIVDINMHFVLYGGSTLDSTLGQDQLIDRLIQRRERLVVDSVGKVSYKSLYTIKPRNLSEYDTNLSCLWFWMDR